MLMRVIAVWLVLTIITFGLFATVLAALLISVLTTALWFVSERMLTTPRGRAA